MSGLLATKLHRPSIPANWVQRPNLIQQLNEGLEIHRQLTLVSAPAGFGKTTCISAWVNSLEDLPVTWLAMDASDDDPRRFFGYFLAALKKVDKNVGKEIEGVISSGQLPPGEIISATLINDIWAFEDRFLLVLDDFHVIQDSFILQVLEQIIANFPDPLHLVLITREDPPLPLARLRANNQLTEIRARDLCFTYQEIDRYLKDVMSLSLTQADISSLELKTEGWIVGLQLAGLSIRDQANPSTFIAKLSGSHRFILSYLTEQVLDQQTEEVRQFLLEISILDALNGDLCNSVTGRSDSSSLLEQLYNTNMFIIPLDDERQWYRYHYLFADLLRGLYTTLHKGEAVELHRRAGQWYAQTGMMNEAIQHALAAEDYAMAVDLLEKHAMEMIMQGYAKTVNGWVQSLPKELIAQSPRTNLAFAWALILRGVYTQASEYLDKLQTTLIDSPLSEENASLKAEWLVMQSLVLYMQGKTMECLQMTSKAVELTPETNSRVWSLAFYVQASVLQLQGDSNQAFELYQKSIRYSLGTESLFAEMMSTISLANIALERGQLHLAYEIASRAVNKVERSRTLYPMSAVIYASLGDVCYQWYQINKARDYFQKALHLSILGGTNTITLLCHVLLSRLSQIEGDLETSESEIHKAIDLVPADVPEYVQQEVISQQVRIYLASNRLDAAELVFKTLGLTFKDQLSFVDFPSTHSVSVANHGSVSTSMMLLINSYLQVVLNRASAEDDPTQVKEGIKLAHRAIAWSLKNRQYLITLDTLLLRAQMNNVLQNNPASTVDYLKALELGEPEGFIAVFVEAGKFVEQDLADISRKDQLPAVQAAYLKQILEAFNTSHPPGEASPIEDLPVKNGQARLIEPLSDRELEVLGLIAKGLKYREIASMLFITQNTVRFHIKSIYGKLNVNNRTQAIDKAHQFQIL
jgi:LuxR family maltose regulon positive regulatory protein